MTLRNPRRTAPPEDCPLDACLKFLSSAWTTRIVWFLGMGPRRFGDLRRDLGGISTKVLSDRLRSMEKKSMIVRRALPTTPAQVEYSLTPLGREFAPVITAMTKLGDKLRDKHGVR